MSNKKYPPTWVGIQPLLTAAVEGHLLDAAQAVCPRYPDGAQSPDFESALTFARLAMELQELVPQALDFYNCTWPSTEVPQDSRESILWHLNPEGCATEWYAIRLAQSFGAPIDRRYITDCHEGAAILAEKEFRKKFFDEDDEG